MAIRIADISSVDALKVEHKGSQFVLARRDGDAILIPFAYALSLKKDLLKPVVMGEKIPFNRVLRPNQVAPTMVMKMRLNSDGYALNAQGCGDGKTTQAYWVISQLNPKRTLIVTHLTNLQDQWVNEGKECMGFEPWKARDPEKVGDDARVVVTMIHVMDKFNDAFLKSVDLLIVDECDRIAGPVHGNALLMCTAKRVLGLTATSGELNSKDVYPVLSLIYGPKPILPGVRKPFKVMQVLYPYKPPVVQKWYTDSNGKRKLGPDWQLITSSSASNHRRNVDVVTLARTLLSSCDDHVFILCKFVYNVEFLARICEHIGMKKNSDYSLVYGDGPVEACARLYIGTYSKGEAGFDEKSLKGFDGKRVRHVISSADVMDPRQGIGRAFRADDPCVWEILDDCELTREYHAPMKIKWYTENGATSIKLINFGDIDVGADIDVEAPPPREKKSWGNSGGGNSGGVWRGGRGGGGRGSSWRGGAGRGGRGGGRGRGGGGAGKSWNNSG
ncbi:MAG TPA: DEAD/DEAH box helicase family protein, partial [Saprospiraceae bacterium]|nr:DEAD/DEAH box helicase family protein [Saprospiraceae bacterium]